MTPQTIIETLRPWANAANRILFFGEPKSDGILMVDWNNSSYEVLNEEDVNDRRLSKKVLQLTVADILSLKALHDELVEEETNK